MADHFPGIAIIGAGPAGLCLAQLLRQSSIPSTIYERDPDPTSRGTQGSSLDLHWDTGLLALKKAGLWEEFLKHARYEGQAMVIADKHNTRYLDENAPVGGPPGGSHGSVSESKEKTESRGGPPGPSLEQDEEQRPEIDRAALRQILLDALPKDAIRWGQKVLSVSENSNGTIDLNLDDGTAEPHDLVVGADGAWSRVRPFLTDTRPTYTGVGGFDLKIQNGASVPDVSAFVGAGSYMAFGDAKTILAQQNGSGAIVVYAWAARDEGWEQRVPYDVKNPAAVKAALKQEYAGWSDDILRLTQVADGEVLVRSLYVLPAGHAWRHRRGATLVGDAAHLMTPFAGEGVNMALADGLELAQGIVEAVRRGNWGEEAGGLDEAVRRYEEGMFPRAAAGCEESWENMRGFMFEPGFPQRFAGMMGPRMGLEGPSG